jgi:hypothetical protein
VSEITELSKEDDIKPVVASNEFDQGVEGRLDVRGDLELIYSSVMLAASKS